MKTDAAEKRQYIHYLIALIIGLVITFALQPVNGLTETGVRVVAILVPTLYLWLTTNTHWTCLLALALLVTTGAMTPNEVWAGSMGHFVVITVITYMILNVCLKETGVIDKIAMWFVTRPFVKGRPYVFFAMFFASNIIIGFFMDNLSLAIIYIGIAEVLAKHMNIKKGDSMYTVLFCGVMWGNVLLSCCSPIAHALPNILIGLLETQCGITVSYASWLGYGAIYAVIIFIAMMIIIRVWNPDTSNFKNYDVEKVKAESKPLERDGIIAAVIFILVVICVLAPSILKGIPFLSTLGSWGVTVPALFGVVALALLRHNGKSILNVPSAMKQLPLPPIIFAGTVSVFAVPLSAENTGITAWLGNLLRPSLGQLSQGMIIVALIALAIIMTNFLSNTVTQVLFFNIGVVLLSGSNYSMAAFCIVIGIASGMATITPSAAVPSPLFFGPGHVTMKNTLIPNLAFLVVCFVVCAFVGVPLATAIAG